MAFLDLSHTIEHGMTTYPGLPGPIICDFMSREASRGRYAPGVEFHIGKIEMVANTGTYLDAPFHRYADGKDLSQLPLDSLAGLEAVVVRRSGGARYPGGRSQRLRGARRARQGRARSDRLGRALGHAGLPRGQPVPHREGSRVPAANGAALVGIDSLNIDDIRDAERPVHSILLGAGIPIVEHLCNLGPLPESGFRFSAVPAKVAGFGSWPVRAFATL